MTVKPKRLFCSECGAVVFSASPDDEKAGVMCLECSGDSPVVDEDEEFYRPEKGRVPWQ